MGLDKANIFKLNDNELTKYQKDPFLDCFESTKVFAKALKNDIDTKETPHSLLLSADYGMGKTFFSTRFTQYLRNNKYDVIYFSVWENDYMQEPFLAFAKVILNYIHNKFKAEKYKANATRLFDITEKLAESITFSMGIGFNISAEKLISAFKTDTEPIVEFRKQLTSFINKIPKKKLIIIVDELDRCRPDYAMKTLECIKHFFEIEGLFVILPTNKESLNNCIKSLYGIDNTKRIRRENYFQKFFNDKRIIKTPSQEDYIYAVNQYLTEDRLKEAFNKKLLSEQKEQYNSCENLKNFFAEYAYKAGLTVRELKDSSIELARICNNFYEPIRVQWLSCIMAYKDKSKDDYYFNYPLPQEHCFYDNKPHVQRGENGKTIILELNIYKEVFRKLKKLQYERDNHGVMINPNKYSNFINDCIHHFPKINKYAEIIPFFNTIETDLSTLETEYTQHSSITQNLQLIKNAITEEKNKILEYQIKYGSDDNDETRKSKYLNIINNFECLYSTTC